MVKYFPGLVSLISLPLTKFGLGYADKGKALIADNQRVPNSGSQSMTSTGASTSSIDKPSLVYQLQKMNGVEKKRCSRTRRDQPAVNKPGSLHQKSHHRTRTYNSTTQQTSPGPSRHSPSRRKDVSRFSGVEAPASYFDPLPPRASLDEHISPQSSATFLSQSSSPSSSYHLSAGTSSLSPGSTNSSPFQASSLIPTAAFNYFQHMAPTSQTTPGFLSPSSPGYHEFQGHDHPTELKQQHPVSHTIPVEGSHLVTQHDNVYGPSRSYWNEYDERQGRIKLSKYPQLTHQREQATTASFLPLMSHILGTPSMGNSSRGYFYPGYEDHTTSTFLQDAYLLAGHSSEADSSSTIPYYS